MKKNAGNLIQHELFFKAPDREGDCTGPGLFFYYKKIPICLLANQYTLLRIVNNTKVIVYEVVLYLNSKKYYFK